MTAWRIILNELFHYRNRVLYRVPPTHGLYILVWYATLQCSKWVPENVCKIIIYSLSDSKCNWKTWQHLANINYVYNITVFRTTTQSRYGELSPSSLSSRVTSYKMANKCYANMANLTYILYCFLVQMQKKYLHKNQRGFFHCLQARDFGIRTDEAV
jgi:hypothetical protein